MYDGEQFYVQPATPVKTVVDTMGAGDSFLTAFYGLLCRSDKKKEQKNPKLYVLHWQKHLNLQLMYAH